MILCSISLSAYGQQEEESIRFLIVIHSMQPITTNTFFFSFLQISLILLQERLVLAVFYYATGGDQWSASSTNWLTATHHKNWYGVTTDSRTNWQLQLSLDHNSLRGSIPTEIGNLTSLKGLFLKNNYLSGSIPTQIGSLTSLQFFYLYDNTLSGSIPDGVCDLNPGNFYLQADCVNCNLSKAGCCYNYCP